MLGATAITLATAIPAGYGLAFGSFRGRKLILKLTLVVMLMPASTLVLPIFLELNALRLIGSILSIILPFSFFPFGVYLAYIYYSTALPAELLDAARVDGCSEWATFRHIGMPLARPVVALVSFFSFVANWTNFFLPYAFLANDRQLPVQVGLSDNFRSTRPAVALAALIAALPIAIVFVVSQRALVRGLVGGATKGERSRLRTEVISPSPSSRANRSASRRSVFTLSAAGLIFDGAATTQLIPAPAHARASRYPVGPASYTTRTGASSVFSHSTVSADPAGTRSDRTLPLPASITPATTDRACTCPTQLPSDIRRPVIAALPPRQPRRQPAPTYVARRRHSIRSGPCVSVVRRLAAERRPQAGTPALPAGRQSRSNGSARRPMCRFGSSTWRDGLTVAAVLISLDACTRERTCSRQHDRDLHVN